MGSPRRLSFGEYELHTDSGELFRGGERVALQHQPAQLLEVLAGRAGEVVSRDEIRDAIWGSETYVDSEQGINYCIRQIRQALDDDAAAPRYVETVPRHGYRFLAPVEERAGAAVAQAGEGAISGGRRTHWTARRAAAAIAAAALVVLLAGALAQHVGQPEEEAVEPEPSAPVPLLVPEEAHARFLEARYLIDRATEGDTVEDAENAVELLQAVVAEVPEHAEAHAALADAWLLRFDLPRAEAMENAEAAARRALELDPSLLQARTVLAATLFFHRLDWQGARENLEQVLEAAPDFPDAVFLNAVYLSAVGRHDEAIAGARRAARLDPRRLPEVSLAWFYFFPRRYDRAVTEAERILALRPLDEPSHRVLVFSYLARGDDASATREVDRYFRLAWEAPDDVPLDLPPARELYRSWWEHRAEERRGEVSPTLLASFGAVAGETEGVLPYLQRACEEHAASWDLPFVAVDPRWDPLRSDPRFQQVLDCVGVPGFARRAPRVTVPEE